MINDRRTYKWCVCLTLYFFRFIALDFSLFASCSFLASVWCLVVLHYLIIGGEFWLVTRLEVFAMRFFRQFFFSTINVVIKVVCARQKEQKFDFSTFFMFLTFIYARLHLNHLFYFMAITQSVFFSFWKWFFQLILTFCRELSCGQLTTYSVFIFISNFVGCDCRDESFIKRKFETKIRSFLSRF